MNEDCPIVSFHEKKNFSMIEANFWEFDGFSLLSNSMFSCNENRLVVIFELVIIYIMIRSNFFSIFFRMT